MPLFSILLLVMTLLFIFTGILFLKMNESRLPFWEKLPRERISGGILGLIALFVFIPNVKPLFSPDENLFWLIPSALILAVLCFLYLDHLFARSAAACTILLVHWMLGKSYEANLRFSWLFALLSLIAGTFAIFIAAKPYWLRDCFRAMCRQFKWRLIGAVFSFLWAISVLILLIQLFGRTTP